MSDRNRELQIANIPCEGAPPAIRRATRESITLESKQTRLRIARTLTRRPIEDKRINSSQDMQVQTQPAQSPRETVTLDVEGMKCAGCVSAVERQIKNHPGVVEANVNLVTKIAVIHYSIPSAADPDAIARQLTEKGFPAHRRSHKQESDRSRLP